MQYVIHCMAFGSTLSLSLSLSLIQNLFLRATESFGWLLWHAMHFPKSNSQPSSCWNNFSFFFRVCVFRRVSLLLLCFYFGVAISRLAALNSDSNGNECKRKTSMTITALPQFIHFAPRIACVSAAIVVAIDRMFVRLFPSLAVESLVSFTIQFNVLLFLLSSSNLVLFSLVVVVVDEKEKCLRFFSVIISNFALDLIWRAQSFPPHSM